MGWSAVLGPVCHRDERGFGVVTKRKSGRGGWERGGGGAALRGRLFSYEGTGRSDRRSRSTRGGGQLQDRDEDHGGQTDEVIAQDAAGQARLDLGRVGAAAQAHGVADRAHGGDS